MQIHFQFLKKPLRLREVLRSDGWVLEPHSDEDCLATHPQVNDESSARSRLYRIGLLTSSALRIEFKVFAN